MPLTKDEIVSLLGPVDDTIIAQIAETGASLQDLREALAWLNNDEALMAKAAHCRGPRSLP